MNDLEKVMDSQNGTHINRFAYSQNVSANQQSPISPKAAMRSLYAHFARKLAEQTTGEHAGSPMFPSIERWWWRPVRETHFVKFILIDEIHLKRPAVIDMDSEDSQRSLKPRLCGAFHFLWRLRSAQHTENLTVAILSFLVTDRRTE
jgi:hypothetical protein